MEENWTEFLRKWQVVTASGTKQEFMTKWDEFLKYYANKPEVLKYLQEIWIPHKEHYNFTCRSSMLFSNSACSHLQ
ncbi:12874_t:CDS:1, partial [Gigaspora rosea]